MSAAPGDGPSALAFGEFVLDVANARLSRAGRPLPLTPKPFALLAELAQRPGELVSKDHLLDTVWRRRFVSDSAVKSVLSELRAALGDDARAPRWIETVQARGYRFVGTVNAAAPPATSLAAPEPGNLPLLHTPLLGRDDELQRLRAAPGPALLTLTGPAGVGKSLLALALALRWRDGHADGAWRVDLGGLPPGCDAAMLRASVAQALRLSDAAARDDEALARSLQGLRLLVVLDNAEHVLEPLAPMLSHLLARLPTLQLLVTSREPLHLPMEQLHRVPPLSVPEPDDDADPARCAASGAGQLFLARVAARQSGFVLGTDDAPALALLCRALDGLPLALELAAARVPMLGLRGLAQQLAPADGVPGFDRAPARLRLLGPAGMATGGARRGAARHQTLREALDWSHALLTPLQQRVLRRLAVFQGPFGLPAAQQVAADPEVDDWGLIDTLDALVDRSLLVASVDEPRRFHLLHSIRSHAEQRLLDAGEGPLAQARHFAATLAYWRAADARALGDPALQWVQQHDHALADLRSALAWGCDAVCAVPAALPKRELLALAGASGLLWHRAGHAREGVRWCERVLALCNGVAPEDRAGVDLALAHLGGIAMVLPAPQGLAAARRAVQALAWQGDTVRENYALYLQHTLMCRAEPEADRSACLQRMRALVQPDWGELLRRFERSAVAYEARLQGGADAYLAFNRAELARCRALGATWEAWSAGIGVMLAEHDNGRLPQAVAVGREVLGDIRAAGRLRQNANRLAMWLMMLAESGDTAGTRAALQEAVPILQGAGRFGMALLSAAWLAAHEERPHAAVQALARFDAASRTGGEFGPGTFIRRSVGLLWARLRALADDAAVAEARAEAEELSDAEALRQVLDEGPRAGGA